MGWYNKRLAKSLWVFHVSGSPCNNCDIEILDLLTPKYDVERLGIKLVGSVRHADVLLLTGIMNKKVAPKKNHDSMSRHLNQFSWWQLAHVPRALSILKKVIIV